MFIYSAELGRGTGAAFNASIKSGSNSVHGSLWENFSTDRMNAMDYFATSKTAYHSNESGATLGHGGAVYRPALVLLIVRAG